MLNEWVWLPFLIRFFQIQLLYQGELFFILFVTVIVECRRQQKLNSWNALAMERWRKSSRKSPCTQLPEWQGGGSIILKCNEHYPSLISYDSHSWRKTIHLKENAGDEWSRHTRFKPRAENSEWGCGRGWVGVSVFQCLTLCDPRDWQARILEWVAIFSSRESSQLEYWTYVSCISCTGRWTFYHWEAQRINWGCFKQDYL